MENKYEKRVRERAEEFSRSFKKSWDKLPVSRQNGIISNYVPLARLSVQREAEAFESAWVKAKSGPSLDTLQEILQSLGLVPQNTTTMYTEKQIETWRVKADQWDALEKRIAACYVTEGPDGEMEENTDPDIDLGTIGEIAASAFGYL